MLDARRMHWFGKSMMEFRTVQQTLHTITLPREVRYLHALSRFFFALRWGSENWQILYKIGALADVKAVNATYYATKAARLWLVALCCGALTELCKLIRLHRGEPHLSRDQRKQIRYQCYRTLLCHLGDMGIPLSRGLAVEIPEKRLAAMHLVSGLIQSSNLYPPKLGC
ncbi:unnamed protein product [Amoebophrya sp. A120]|nr:unnamed protein product [Amoebophrya sp. A120]|eukprot:GSA120T00016273001.1